MQLQTVICHRKCRVCYVKLCHRTEFCRVWRPIVQFPCRLAQECAGGLQFDLHICQAELKRLELVDGFAKGFAFPHISERHV